ncbi:MAG: hypothetical protein WKF30_18980 [Pyrinomonadaceae bacterium]
MFIHRPLPELSYRTPIKTFTDGAPHPGGGVFGLGAQHRSGRAATRADSLVDQLS